ncbi:MAG TPA: flippase [Candidatus Binataceae bacterium]|nr:flippase [Candidatus Binataceae bacterium]
MPPWRRRNRAMMQDAGIHSEASLTSGRRLIRNVIWNGAGELGPLVAAFIAMPILIHTIGAERFGILALAWTVFGYFGLLDMGVSSALTKLISDRLATGRRDEVPALIGTALAMLTAFGLIGAAAMGASVHLLVHSLFKVPPALQGEATGAFVVMALGLPICIMNSSLAAILAAHQRFDLINLVRSPNTIFSSLGPLCVLPFSHSIVPIVVALFAGNALTWIVYFAMCLRTVPKLARRMRFRRALVRELAGFGFWVASSNCVAMMMGGFDRFALAAMASMNAVSYYIVPARILHKLRVVPEMINGVLFPAFAHSLAEDRARTRMLFERGAKSTVLLMFPIVLIVVMFAREMMTLWIGAEFAAHSAPLVQLLAVAAMLDAIGTLAAELTSAAHRPDINLKIHAAELPFYLGFMFVMVYWRGAEGAAIAYVARAGVDSLAHWVTARTILPVHGGLDLWLGGFLLAAFASMTIAVFPLGLGAKILIVAAVIAGMYSAAWLLLMDDDDRRAVLAYLSTARAPIQAAITGAVD